MRISDWSSDVCSSDLIRRLTWHGNNKMERMNLPTAAQGGFNYADSAVMFRRLTNGSFELIVTPWESDLARSWRQASAQRQTLFCLEIGRASCRERVCPYVSVSVVAGSFKKKK